MYANALGLSQYLAMAKKYFSKACDLGFKEGCELSKQLNQTSDFNEGIKAYNAKNYEKAKELWQKACDSKDARACFNLGMFYNEGQGITKDYQKAKEFFEKGCDGGDALGCKIGRAHV